MIRIKKSFLTLLIIAVMAASGCAADKSDEITGTADSSVTAGTSDISDTSEISETDDTSEISETGDTSDTSETADTEIIGSADAPTTLAVGNLKAVISAELTPGNSWPESGKTVVQYSCIVSNTGNAPCSAWTLTVDVPKDAVIIGSWNGVYSLDNGKLIIKNESYNGEIPAGGSIEIGFQLKGAENLKKAKGTGTTSTLPASTNNPNNTNNPITPGTPPPEYKPSNIKGKQGDDWLFVKGNKIVDKDGKEVWLTGINWFGYNTGTNTFDGLWACNLESSLQGIADHGFNLLRVPMSAELVKNWQNGVYPKANYNNADNAVLNSMNSLEIFEYVLEICQSVGIKVMIDIHSAKTDSMGHMYAVWYNGDVSVNDYYGALEWLAARYKDNDTIIAYDLKNEPHGKPDENPRAIWNGSADADNWKYAAETAALKILAKNPNVLIMVEGIEIYPKDIKSNNFTSKNSADYDYNWWGGNLRGVKDYPVNLGKYQNKLVYSPHDYGPAVYQQPWFTAGYGYDSLMKDCWRDNWFYIYENNTAPLLIGEWGGFMTEPNLTWMTHLRTLIKTYKLHHTFWCFNSNSGDTGGLVKDDFKTWDTEKYNFLKEVLWQKNGKFVGLDHEIPLGSNGIALKNY